MTDSEVIEAVNDVFANSFEIPREQIKPDAQIFADLGLDSLDIVDLVAAIQKRFGIQVRDDERIRSIRSMQDLYTYLIMVKAEQKKA
ncbi:MAG: phosphopantetheine-binding protein [Tepidisphaeraceae bacterium]|jgi:acyl carrier protein